MPSSLVVLAFAAITGLLYYGQPVLLPFVLAVFIFSMFSPTLDWMVLRLRFPQPLALTISFLLVLVVAAFVFPDHRRGLPARRGNRGVVQRQSRPTRSNHLFARVSKVGLTMDPEHLTGDLQKVRSRDDDQSGGKEPRTSHRLSSSC